MNNDHETIQMVKLTIKTVAMLGAVFLAGVVVLILIGIAKKNLQ